jgi:hypothetical protein
MNQAPQNNGGSDSLESVVAGLRQRALRLQQENESKGRLAALKRDQRKRWYEGYYESEVKLDELIYVRRTPEVDRVRALPTWDYSDAALAPVGEFLTNHLKTPEGTQTLRIPQAAMLQCLYDNGSALGSVSCGGGKTLMTALAPVLMQSQRAVLVIPAKLKKKTLREFKEIAEHWKTADIKIVSYAYLSRNKEFLDKYQPDLLMGDEFHKFKNTRAACTRQVDRYLMAHPECHLLGVSGTLMKRSLMDFHHMARWVAGREGMPLPADADEAKLWARAVDQNPPGNRILPGWLALWREGKYPTLTEVDKAVGKRVYSTPGFYRTESMEYGGSLLIETLVQIIPTEIEDILAQMKETRETPGGDIALPQDVWRHKRELSLGFYYTWDPKPPDDWLAARRIWRSFVREIIEMDDGWDTEMQVANGCKSGKIDHHGRYTRWTNIRSTFKPNTVTRWVTDQILKSIIGSQENLWYMKKPALVWVEHQAVGYKLAQMTGLKYFRSQGLSDDGTYIEDIEGKESAIVSIGSNAEGLNLQKWSENIILTPQPAGRTMEQLLARTHRPGQLEDEVGARIYKGITGDFEKSLRDALHIQNVQGAPQRLLMADIT